MAAPPDHNPRFHPLHAESLPDAIGSLAGCVYVSVAYAPGPPGQALTTAVEPYFDLTSPGLAAHQDGR